MNLPKAIELNKETNLSLRKHKFYDHADAVLLGAEALKRHETLSKLYPFINEPPLPGETKD